MKANILSYVNFTAARDEFRATVKEVRRLHDEAGLTYKEIDLELFGLDHDANMVSYEVFTLTAAAKAVA